jgi:hypothetical protein
LVSFQVVGGKASGVGKTAIAVWGCCANWPARASVVVAVIAMTAGRVEAASAEVGAGPYPTSQAVAADALFLAYAPPPPQPGIVCLVDSGVDPNPDTNAAVVGSEAVVPAWGTGDGMAQVQPPVEGHPAGHGTEMAMLMAAPQNGWGMVGLAPSAVRVYSIRAIPTGKTTFPFSAYSFALNRCLKLRAANPAVTVANLSLSGPNTPTDTDLTQIEDSVDTARFHGLDVVGAAGNAGSSSAADYPAAYPSVLVAGAGDAGPGSIGVLCAFSGRDGLDVIAPGCNTVTGGVDQAFEDDGTPALGFGTSQASALTSAVLAAMRAYGPELDVAHAEWCLTTTEVNGGNLDVAAAFQACGLADVVQAGLAATPSAEVTSSLPDGPGAGSGAEPPVPLARPRLGRLRVRRGKLTVTALNRPDGATVEVKVVVRRGHRSVVVASGSARASTVTLHVRAASVVRARFVLSTRESPWITRVIG